MTVKLPGTAQKIDDLDICYADYMMISPKQKAFLQKYSHYLDTRIECFSRTEAYNEIRKIIDSWYVRSGPAWPTHDYFDYWNYDGEDDKMGCMVGGIW